MLAQLQEVQAGKTTVVDPGSRIQIEAITDNDGIRVQVTLAPELASQTKPEDTLFVFARAADGMPMPVAVSRLTVADFPTSVLLNDAKAMMPSRLLSSFKEIQVVARISKSGNAIAESGDLSSDVQSSTVGDNVEVLLMINKIIP